MVKIINNLNNLINSNILKINFPIIEKNKVIINHCVIKKGKKKYKIHDLFTNEKIDETYTRLAAVVLSKKRNMSLKTINEIKHLDFIIMTNSNDIFFYRNSIKNNPNSQKSRILEDRMNACYEKINQSTEILKSYIDHSIFTS